MGLFVRTLPLLAIAAMGCTTWPSPKVGSGVDSNFRLKKIETQANFTSTNSPGVRTYQKWVSPVLGSHCRYYPSDSRYHVTVSKTCGPLKATVKSMSRFLLEYDAPKLGRAVILQEDGVHYEDLPTNCSWL